ncbi:NTP transferase domain-containing protein [Candidatus Peregrinibacteria bacterium]|nr:NTP transferase domain-containing protein [Candidatus Peregrinibacteria bacterium]
MITKGIILAGGSGTRLRPFTKFTSKHLLPVYDEPLIYFPLKTLLQMGIQDILLITAPHHADNFLELLGYGNEFGARIEYKIQEEPNGIAAGLLLAENFAHGENVALVLGDNIFFDDLSSAGKDFSAGAEIFITKVEDPERFGVVELNGKNVITLEEKPKNPKSSLVQTGLYLYDTTVFDKIRNLKPSPRNELEITDLNNLYLSEKTLKAHILENEWIDAGTFESLLRGAEMVRKLKNIP